VAPLAVLDADSQQRLKVHMTEVRNNLQKLQSITDWPGRILQALEVMDGEQQKRFDLEDKTVDGQIYDGFMNDGDQKVMAQIRGALPDELSDMVGQCQDSRLKELLPLYKARNFAKYLSTNERQQWEAYKAKQLLAGGPKSKLARYFNRLQQLSEKNYLTQNQRYLLEDLNLYGQSIMPADVESQ
jgi:exodeoxyribonuclease-1